MSNPLRMFRKYQATFLVAFGIILMFAFVVGPILSDYLSSGVVRGTGENPVVVAWKDQQLLESDMHDLRTVHLQTTRFLRELVQRAIVLDDDVVVQRQGQAIRLTQGSTYELRGRDADNFQIVVDGVIVTVPENKPGTDPKPQIRQLGRPERLIPQSPGEEDLFRRLLLSQEARKQGVVVGEETVLDYLDTLCGVTVETRPDYAGLLRVSTSGHLDMQGFVGHVAMELSADRMLVMLRRGFLATPSGMPAAPPEVLFESYNKLNRRVIAEMMAVKVSDFVGEVGKPTEEEISALYDEGKDRFPDPRFPEPGFKQRKKMAFQFVVARFDEFMQREKDRIGPTITDEEIEQYYDNNPDQFREIELPDDETQAEDATEDGDTASDETNMSDAKTDADGPAKPEPAKPEPGKTEPAKKEPAKTEPAKTEPAKTEPAKTEPAKTEPAKTEPAKKEPAKTEPAKTEPAKKEPAKKEPAKTEPAKTEPAKVEPAKTQPKTEQGKTEQGKTENASGDDQVSKETESVMFVSYQEPETQGEPAQKTPPQKTPPQKTPSKKTADEPAQKAVGEPAGESQEPKKEEPKKEEPKKEEPEKEEPKKEEPSEEDPQMESGSEAQGPASDPAAKQEAEEPPAKLKPLDDELREEIRGRIADQRAKPIVRAKIEESMEKVRGLVDQYQRDRDLAKALDKTAPTPLDIAAIAQENDLAYGETPLWNTLQIVEIRDEIPADDEPPAHELARATENVEFRFNRSLIDVAFVADLEQYSPRRLVDGILLQQQFPIDPQKVFVFWPIDQEPEFIPELKAARNDVMAVWKMQQALPKAQAKAEELAGQAAKDGKSLVDVFPDDKDSVISTMQFSWMTRGAMPGGQAGRPMLSQINGLAGGQPKSIAGAGNDFMRSVFDLQVGEVGTATNEPEDYVYVVRIVSEDLTEKQRRDAFYVTGLTPEVMSMVNNDQTETLIDWIEALDKTYNVKWKRPAQNDWRFDQ